jgi:hypothetical protein
MNEPAHEFDGFSTGRLVDGEKSGRGFPVMHKGKQNAVQNQVIRLHGRLI